MELPKRYPSTEDMRLIFTIRSISVGMLSLSTNIFLVKLTNTAELASFLLS